MELNNIIAALDALLEPQKYRDYAPNGLQVEGRHEVRRIVTGVTACLDLIHAARERGADLLLVHHGWFWKREDPRITGVRHKRISALLAADMGLAAYHLPLDDHPEIGNNALFGRRMGFIADGRFGEDALGWIGQPEEELPVRSLAQRICRHLNREPLLVGPTDKRVRRVAWCTGAAQDMIEEAAAAGADCFISGEISERTTHLARELGIAYLACGHHATERFGIEALGRRLADEYSLEVEFIDIDNPV